jgi:hypothetical protein
VRHHAGQVAADRGPEAHSGQAADRVEDAAVDERVAEAGGKRRQAELAAGAHLVAVVVGVEVERGRQRRLAVRAGGELDRLAQLVLVLRVAQCRVLVEPLGGEHLGGVAEAFAAVVEADVDANERLHALGDGDDAEANGRRRRNGCSNASTPSTLSFGANGGAAVIGALSVELRSVEPAWQVLGDEGVVGEVGVLAADAVDRLALPGAQPSPGRGTTCLRAGPGGAAPRGSRRCSRGSRGRRRRRRCCSR